MLLVHFHELQNSRGSSEDQNSQEAANLTTFRQHCQRPLDMGGIGLRSGRCLASPLVFLVFFRFAFRGLPLVFRRQRRGMKRKPAQMASDKFPLSLPFEKTSFHLPFHFAAIDQPFSRRLLPDILSATPLSPPSMPRLIGPNGKVSAFILRLEP